MKFPLCYKNAIAQLWHNGKFKKPYCSFPQSAFCIANRLIIPFLKPTSSLDANNIFLGRYNQEKTI